MRLSTRALLTTAVAAATAIGLSVVPHGPGSTPAVADSPGPAVSTVDAAPDFATTAFSDPWDYSNVEDVHVEAPPQANATYSGGAFRYDAAGTYPWFDPLPYFPGSTAQEKDGPTHPIDADLYTRVSFRMYSSQNGYGGLNWATCDWSKNPRCQGQMGFGVQAGWHVYTLTPRSDQPTMPAAWAHRVIGLRVIPIAAKPGTHLAVDWMRVFHPASPVAFTVPVPTPGRTVHVMWESTGDQPGSGELTQVRTSSAMATVQFPYDAFPPGSYRLYAVGPEGQRGADTSPLTVTAPPRPVVDTPNAAGADDYATIVNKHPWNFVSLSTSVAAHNNMSGLTILPGGVLRGQNTGPEIDNPYFYLPLKAPIPGTTWHRLTVRVRYDGPFGLNGGPTGGCVGRLIWYLKSDLGRDDQNIQDLVLYSGWNTITVDLRTNPPAAVTDDTQKAHRIGWAGQWITGVRWDPNEDVSHRTWYVDDIRLARDPVSYGGADVTFHDPGLVPGERATVYLSTGRFHTDAVAASAPVTVQPGRNTVHVTVPKGVRGGLYWARVVVDSANGSATQWSTGPVNVVMR